MRKVFLAPVLLSATFLAAQQPAQNPATQVMGQQCVMNHPLTASLELTMLMMQKPKAEDGDAAKAADPVTITVAGDVARDSDGRFRMVMRVPIPKQDKPFEMTMIVDPIEKHILVFNEMNKTYTEQPLEFHGQCTSSVPTVQDSEAAMRAANFKFTRLDDKQIEGYPAVGYTIELPVAMLGKDAAKFSAKPVMTLWMDVDDALPLDLRMEVADEKSSMDMHMTFKNIHRVDTPVAAFTVPDGYKKAEMPTTPAAPSTTAK